MTTLSMNTLTSPVDRWGTGEVGIATTSPRQSPLEPHLATTPGGPQTEIGPHPITRVGSPKLSVPSSAWTESVLTPILTGIF